MKLKPNILITNDDGIHAPGIRQLCQALQDFANIAIIAPLHEQSAAGLSITIRQPLRVEPFNWSGALAWSVTGTPADCIKLGLSAILDYTPDFVISGINRGSNAGRNLLYSGTVGGAIEGTLRGIPSIAFSCWDLHETDYSHTTLYIPTILKHIIEHPLPSGTLLNVNFPSRTIAPMIKGVKLTRQGKEYWLEKPEKRFHPAENHPYYWMGVKLASFDEEEDCDISWLNKGYAAAVPVHVNELTDHVHLNAGREAFDALF